VGVCVLACWITSLMVLTAAGIEGFGSRACDGGGQEVVWVDPRRPDTDADQHGIGTPDRPYTLRRALGAGDRIIRFTRAGTITLNASIYIQQSNITIDGASAPAPGVTITHTPENHGGLIFGSPGRKIGDFVLAHLRFRGVWDKVPEHVSGYTILGTYIDDDRGGKVENMVFDHLTICNHEDKVSFWGHVENVTVSRCLFYDSHMGTLVSIHSLPYQLRRKGFSIHHNVFARCRQRSPQLRGWIEQLEYVNNIVYGWEMYGMRIKNEPGERSVNANVVNNVFCSDGRRPDSALIYGWEPGPDYADRAKASDFPQGTVYMDNEMGQLHVAGNILPAANRDQYSTVEGPLEIPDWAKVGTVPADGLGQAVLPDVGMAYRSEYERQLLAEVAEAIGTAPG